MGKAANGGGLCWISTRGGIRTCGLLLRRQALYPLSYAGLSEWEEDSDYSNAVSI
jgi:hypothetical protein